MVMAFLLTAAAFVVIFVHVGGYAEVSTTDLFHDHLYSLQVSGPLDEIEYNFTLTWP